VAADEKVENDDHPDHPGVCRHAQTIAMAFNDQGTKYGVPEQVTPAIRASWCKRDGVTETVW